MATVYRQERSRYFTAYFCTPDGSRVRTTTKETNEKKALKVAMVMEDAHKTLSEGVAPDAAQLAKAIREFAARIAGNQTEKVSCRSFFEEWLARKKDNTKKLTFVLYKRVVKTFLGHIGARSESPLFSLALKDFQTFADSRLKTGTGVMTVKNELSILSSICGMAMKQGLVDKKPVSLVILPTAVSKKRKILSDSEIKTILAYAEGTSWKTFTLLGYYIGARLYDCAQMTWENVNLAECSLTYVPEKGDRVKPEPVWKPLHPALHKHLKTLWTKTKNPTGPLQPDIACLTRGAVSSHFGKIMDRAGVDRCVEKRENGRNFSAKSFHSTRHTLATNLNRNNISQATSMELVGHHDERVHAGYRHPQEEQMREAIGTLADVTK